VRARTSFQRVASVFALAICADIALAAPATTVRVQFQDGTLSLVARAAPAADVFKAVADETGVRFVVDAEIKPGPITIDLDAMPLERAIRNLLTVIPQAAGHTMTYTRDGRGAPQLVQVTLFGPGKAPAGGQATVYSASGQDASLPRPTPPAH
jgi:type II secretory pathway component GspD/PulD (secretin)